MRVVYLSISRIPVPAIMRGALTIRTSKMRGAHGSGALLGQRKSILLARVARARAQAPRVRVAPARVLAPGAQVAADAAHESARPAAGAARRRLRDLRV